MVVCLISKQTKKSQHEPVTQLGSQQQRKEKKGQSTIQMQMKTTKKTEDSSDSDSSECVFPLENRNGN